MTNKEANTMKKIGYAMIGVTAALALTLSACNMNTTESKNGNEGKELAEQAAESITARPAMRSPIPRAGNRTERRARRQKTLRRRKARRY